MSNNYTIENRFVVGTGYVDSGDLIVTTTPNTEIVPLNLRSTENGSKNLYKFEFINNEPCHFVINNDTRCFRNALEGFSMDSNDAEIFSFKVEEVGTHYRFCGAY